MLIYVAGPYSPYGDRSTQDNIDQAKQIAIQLWEKGHAVICPHLNTAHFEECCNLTHGDYIAGDLQMLGRCDAIVMTSDWMHSKGAAIEMQYAKDAGIPVYVCPDLPDLHPVEVACPQQSKAFIGTVMSMYRLHLSKNSDYSPMNVLGTGEIGVLVRLWDKMARLLNLGGFQIKAEFVGFDSSKQPKHEAIEDSYIDAANYSVIGYLVRHDVWGK